MRIKPGSHTEAFRHSFFLAAVTRIAGAGAACVGILVATACGSGGGGDATGTGPVTPVVASVSISGGSSASLTTGQTEQLTATALTSGGVPVSGQTITWSSSAATVASVVNGLVTATAPGAATITASVNGHNATTAVTVVSPAPVSLTVASGTTQTGISGHALADSIAVHVSAAPGQSAAGLTVSWNTTSGKVSPATSITDANGIARAQWNVGAGSASATASIGTLSTAFTATGRTVAANCGIARSVTYDQYTLAPTLPDQVIGNGTFKAVVLFVDFSDFPATIPLQPYSDSVMKIAPDFLARESYGRFKIDATPSTKWYRMPKTAAAYNLNTITFQSENAYVLDAMNAAGADMDLSQYDIIYVQAAPNTVWQGSNTTAAPIGTGLVYKGKEYRFVIQLAPENGSGGGPGYVMAHETTHLLGLPDLYSFADEGTTLSRQARFAGGWSIMSFPKAGLEHTGWERLKMGWIDSTQVTCLDASGGVEETVTPVETSGGVKLLGAQISPSRALIMEVRQAIDADAKACSVGVLMYTVDLNGQNGQGPLVVIPSRTGSDPSLIGKCGPYYNGTYGVGPDAVDTYTDAADGITVKILAANADGSYRIRLKKT